MNIPAPLKHPVAIAAGGIAAVMAIGGIGLATLLPASGTKTITIPAGGSRDIVCQQGGTISTVPVDLSTIHVLCSAPPATATAIATMTPQPIVTPTLVVPTAPPPTDTPAPATATTIAKTATATNTPTAVIVPTGTPPPATSTPGPGAGCVSNCGTPRFFCDSGGWAFCDDYRDLFCPASDTAFGPTNCTFPDPSRVNEVSADFLSSTDPGYLPSSDGHLIESGFFYNNQEHFHTEINDGNFGLAILRQHQPVDFSGGRTAHIHLEVDLKTESRRYVRVMLSPALVKSETDDRSCGDNGCTRRPLSAIDIWFRGGPPVTGGGGGGCVIQSSNNGTTLTEAGCSANYAGVDNIRNLVDFYISASHVRILVDGRQIADTNIGDPGFTQAYLYLTQAAYNACKDGDSNCTKAMNTFHWDNVAFDGPVLPANGLTPAGFQDVVFNVFRTLSCSVKGMPATLQAPLGTADGNWATYVARFPANVAVKVSDVSCIYYQPNNKTVFGFESVHQ